MLKGKLLNPEILRVLACSGHGSKILIADGNYPFNTGSSGNATKVFLNLMPGIPKVTDVLEALLSCIEVEKAEVMLPADGHTPEIFNEFKQVLPKSLQLDGLDRFQFYEEVRKQNTSLVIATAEQRVYANLLLTIGVVK